ncbi:hypothetical protein GH714_009633 [Hevea brasiliensis]|uniref:At5g58720/SDE5-like UBA-like domain-containing protein n=1 Tax=Hevea brasiliensis TaxID=3981 RepID=A0A6A6KDL3_HEVBR|nr:hypothetical protein GH714_009633 [Hevea brasiliensis]
MHAISSTAQSDVNKKDLEELLEVFGSAFSLDDIASAYCQGRRDTNLAAEILLECMELPLPQLLLRNHCGYDMQKSINELLDLSASTLENCENVGGMDDENSTEKFLEQESVPLHQQVQQLDSAQSDGDGLMVGNLTGSPKKEKDRIGLQKEVLQALFDFSDRSEEAPKITCRVRVVKRSKAFGKLVVECPKDATREHKPSTAEPQVVTGKGANSNLCAT